MLPTIVATPKGTSTSPAPALARLLGAACVVVLGEELVLVWVLPVFELPPEATDPPELGCVPPVPLPDVLPVEGVDPPFEELEDEEPLLVDEEPVCCGFSSPLFTGLARKNTAHTNSQMAATITTNHSTIHNIRRKTGCSGSSYIHVSSALQQLCVYNSAVLFFTQNYVVKVSNLTLEADTTHETIYRVASSLLKW